MNTLDLCKQIAVMAHCYLWKLMLSDQWYLLLTLQLVVEIILRVVVDTLSCCINVSTYTALPMYLTISYCIYFIDITSNMIHIKY